jgi:cysteinyl-tRNA synthetase
MLGFMAWSLFGTKKRAPEAPARVLLTNTLSGTKEVFIPLKAGQVLMYTCGPTAYSLAHIGNLRAALVPDLIARTLTAAGYQLRRVLNITDFGHLVTDGDEGEDKMTKGLKSEGLALTLENMRAMAEKYAEAYIEDLADLKIDTNATLFPRASDYIPQQIALISTLEQKGYAYRTKDGVYYDTGRFTGYGRLGNVNLDAQQEGARAKQADKRHPADFVLWKPDAHLGWESPWGQGFPGWHIECSAMIRALLGDQIDIHTGGEDLEPVHHNNEIAQSEAASGRAPFTRYWLHNAFMTMGGEKASKSLGNVVYLKDLVEKGYHPLALRYFFLQGHYRTPISFSWAALDGAAAALERLWRAAREVKEESRGKSAPSPIREAFIARMRDDLATPSALGVLWDALRSEEYRPQEKWRLLEDAEAHLGLALTDPPKRATAPTELSKEVSDLVARREAARAAKDFKLADAIRDELLRRGYRVDDGPSGPMLTKTP